MSASVIDRLVSQGQLVVVMAGIYQVYPTAGHTDLLRGATLALPNPVVSHQSAAFLLDFTIVPKLEPTVTVASHTTHIFPGVTVRRNDDLKPAHMTRVDGLRTTNVVRTVFDLGGVLEFTEFDAITEGLILEGRLKERHLQRIVDELARKGKPGSRAAKDFLEIRAGAKAGSTVLERKGRAVIASAGLPAPVSQFSIPWSPGKRFDDAYPEARVAIEWDSRSWHQQRAAMASDRARDRTAAAHGWFVLRFTWSDVTERPGEVSASVGRVLRNHLAS